MSDAGFMEPSAAEKEEVAKSFKEELFDILFDGIETIHSKGTLYGQFQDKLFKPEIGGESIPDEESRLGKESKKAFDDMYKHYEAAWKLKEEIKKGKDFSSDKEGVAKVWENFCHSVSQVCKKIMHWVEDKRAKSALSHLADVMEEKTTAQWLAKKCEAAAIGMSHIKAEAVKAGKGFAAKASQAANKVLHPNHARRVAPAPLKDAGKGKDGHGRV